MNDDLKYRQVLAKADYFWDHLDRSDPSSCWEWTGRIHYLKYGIMKVNQRAWMAHRIAWVLTNGMITSKQHVCHACDNPPCCNPAHLFLGDQSINMADMVAKGRQCRGKRRVQMSIEMLRRSKERDPDRYYRLRTARAVFTPDEVREIRRRTDSASQLAKEFGVWTTTIYKIRSGKTYGHISDTTVAHG